jgi:short-subunit dehydrogenase
MAKKLASQGLNVVLVAIGDSILDETFTELKKTYPRVEFRMIGVNLGKTGYLEPIKEATEDIDIQVVFCNAGYVLTGFFESQPLEKQLANLECNATSAVSITHLYLQKMVAKKLRGCFVYTSSAAACTPGPFSALYASTKSFLSVFGASIAAEVKPYGIDVLVFHPSPVASRFYDKTHKLDILDFFKKLAVDPDELPDTVFASIGRVVWRDVGPTAVGFRVLMKIVDYNLMATMTAAFGHLMPDFKRHVKKD